MDNMERSRCLVAVDTVAQNSVLIIGIVEILEGGGPVRDGLSHGFIIFQGLGRCQLQMESMSNEGRPPDLGERSTNLAPVIVGQVLSALGDGTHNVQKALPLLIKLCSRAATDGELVPSGGEEHN